MEAHQKKKEASSSSITSELILKVSGQLNFEYITKISFRSKTNSKIRRIEGLDLCVNLLELDLSFQFIGKIENLERLVKLRDLNLAENNIKKLENLHNLHELQSLNLSGNHISEIPKLAIEPLRNLRIFRLSKNKITKLEEFANLSVLSNLEDLNLNGNQALNQPDSHLHLLYFLPSLLILDGSTVSLANKQQAQRMFVGPPPEAWAVRENIVTYRRELSEAQENKRESQEELKTVESQISSVKHELDKVENELNKLQRELESIETTLSGDETEKINFRKNEMKELVTKAEYLRDASVNLQKKISTARDLSNSKEEQLVDIRNELKSLKNRSFDLNSSDARDNLKDKEQQIENDISEIAEMIEEMEYQYKTVIDDFEDADIKITQIEKEIIELKGSSGLVDSTPKWKEDTGKYRRTPTGGELKRPKSQQSDRLSRGFSIDKDTELFLHKRKEEIIDLIPDLDYKKQGLRSESQRLNKKKEDLKRIIEEKEDLIQDRHSKIEECELFIAKFNTSTSPMRGGGNNTKRMWESLRSLWGLVSENPWDGESEDIPKAIIKWSDYMKDQLSKKLMDSDRFVQLAAQQRIDQATIQHLNAKFQELNEELNKRPNNEKSQQDIEKIEIKCQQEIDRLTTRHQQEIDKLLAKHRDEIDRLNAKIDAYREQEIGWNREKKDLDMLLKASDDKVQQLEGQWLLSENRVREFSQENEEVIAAKAKVDVLLDEQDRLKSRIKNLEELYDEKESESKGKLAKLKGYCEHKAEQYQSLTEDCDKKAKDLDILKETLQNNLMLNEELAEKITIMRKNKHDLDLEVHQSRNEIRDFKTVRQAEDERDKALVAVKKVADALNIEFSNSSSINELMNVVRKVEQSLSSLSDGLEKVEMFKKNKELFVDMYDKNTKELQEEWQALKDAKEEIQNEKYQIDMSRSEKRTLDEQVKQLTLATNELQKIKAALERDNLKIEDRNNLLKDSIKSYEDLKDKLQRDYQHMQAVHETETKKYEELMSDIQTAKSNYKQLKADKIESEAQLNNLRFQSAKLEDRSRDLEIEIKEQDKLIFKLKNKQTEEQARVYDDLKEVNKIINDKQKEIYSFQGLLADYESQRARKEEEILMAKRKIEADSLERELVETAIKNRQQVLRDVEGKISNAEMSLNRIQQDIETISQNFAQKTRKIAQLDLEIDQKHSDLERLKSKFENCSQELKAIDEIVRNNKAELRGLDETIVNKNYEADTILHQVNQKRQELGNVERQLNEKQTLLINDEQRLEDTRAQNQIEEESLNIMKQQAQSLSSRVSKLTEALERVEAHKRQVLNEIEVINQKMSKEEIKHKNELEQLRNAIGNGEQTLRQLMESVQRGRNKLAHDREESQQISEEIHNLNRLREEAEEKYRAVDQELNSLQSNVDKLKQEEDTAMVLLALSGHKIDETIKQRISKLCHSAVELEQVKAQLLDARNKDYKDFRFKKTNPALEELENTALYSGNKVETRPLIQIIEEPIEDYSSLIPENEDVRKILHNLEVTRERLRSLTPVNDLSYD